jgi:hypothetical protein
MEFEKIAFINYYLSFKLPHKFTLIVLLQYCIVGGENRIILYLHLSFTYGILKYNPEIIT